jgi:hypothetical protein
MSAIGAVLGKLGKVPFIVWLWILQLFLLVNAPVIAPPEQVDTLRTIMIVYMIAELMFLDFLPRVPGAKMNLNQSIPWMVGGFVVAVVVVTGVGFVQGLSAQTYALSAPIYLIVLNAVVIGVAETFIFQATLPALITPIPAQILFGIFHTSAYGGDIMAVILAILAGFVFYAITKYTNMYTAMGAHAGYNVAVLHLLTVI